MNGVSPTLFEMLRQSTIPGLNQIRQEAQLHPEFVNENARWAWKVLNIRSYYEHLTPREQTEQRLGLLVPERQAQARRSTHIGTPAP